MSGRKRVGLDGMVLPPAPGGPKRNLVGSRPREIKPPPKRGGKATKEEPMADQAIELDPRDIARALQMDTYDLAGLLVRWSGEALTGPHYETSNMRGPTPLEDFDETVTRARVYLESAHAAYDAWVADNPDDYAE